MLIRLWMQMGHKKWPRHPGQCIFGGKIKSNLAPELPTGAIGFEALPRRGLLDNVNRQQEAKEDDHQLSELLAPNSRSSIPSILWFHVAS